MRRLALTIALGVAAALMLLGKPLGPEVRHVLGGTFEPTLHFRVTFARGPVPLDDVAPRWRARLWKYDVRIQPDGDAVRVDVTGAGAKDAPAIAAALDDPGTLEFREVIEATDLLTDTFRAHRDGRIGDVRIETDSWRVEESGKTFEDLFLIADDRAAFDPVIASLQVPADQQIAFERVESTDRGKKAFWRTYLVAKHAFLDSRHIRSANTFWDPQVNRPEVLVELDDAGTAAFADATSRLVGHKIAIVYDGVVASAPVIQSAITGGRTNISMGGGDAAQQQRDADALVATLAGRGPPLPEGLTATYLGAREPSAAMRWAVPAIGALLAAVAAWLLTGWAASRGWKPAPPVPRTAPANPAKLAGAIAITLGVPIVLWVAARIHLPVHVHGVRPISILSFGSWPVLVAFGLVELVAFVAPPLRVVRTGPADGRPFDRAVPFVLLALAALLSWRYVSTLRDAAADDQIALGIPIVIAMFTTLVAGVFLSWVGARLVSRAGICNGWTVVLASSAIHTLYNTSTSAAVARVDGARLAIAGVALAAVAVALWVTAQRGERRRQPGAGVAPLTYLWTAAWLWSAWRITVAESTSAEIGWHKLPEITNWMRLVVGVVIAIALVRRTRGAVVAAVGFVAFFGLLPMAAPDVARYHLETWAGFAGIALADLVHGVLRAARMGDAVPFIAVHDVERADALVDALTAAGIPATTDSMRTRAYLRGAGGFAPAVVYVPASRLDDAELVRVASDPLAVEAAKVFE